MIKKIVGCIPNTSTCLNLLSGCLAIIFTFRYGGNASPCGLTGYELAYAAMGAAAVFDFLDGASARLLKAFSPLGKDLDSLSDLVSFGVAPAMLVFSIMNSYSPSALMPFAALLIPAFGALRLAKFNNDPGQATEFRGLPIPANAIFWIGVGGWISKYMYPGDIAMLLLIALMCAAMVGSFRMLSLKFKNFSLRENFSRYIIILAAIGFVAFYGLAGLAWVILLYFLISFMRLNRRQAK